MKNRTRSIIVVVMALMMIIGLVAAMMAWLVSRPDANAEQVVKNVRQNLRNQGFKTDLADFDFSTSPELRAREAILTNAFLALKAQPFVSYPNLMEMIGNDSAIVVWKQEVLKRDPPSWPGNNDQLTWEEFREILQTNQGAVDAACTDVLAGPIQFDLNAQRGPAMLLPHLANLKRLSLVFGTRAVMELHDGHRDAAWTNLLAQTRLVTAWNPEPVEVSQLVWFDLTRQAYNTTWQMMASPGWSDAQLARLQTEWAGVNFFRNIPESLAFKRAASVAMCEWERQEPHDSHFSLGEFIKETWRHPLSAGPDLKSYWKRADYFRRGSFEDETNLLIFFRDREVEARAAILATNWIQMRALPGVTNQNFFHSKYASRLGASLNLRELGMAMLKRRAGLYGRAAEAETRRRILITVLALERYRLERGHYPSALEELAPAFVHSVPVDFMNGQPLHYRLREDGHFQLYSVGLDGKDDGGILSSRKQRIRAGIDPSLEENSPEIDMLWPLTAAESIVKARREEEQRQRMNREQHQRELTAAMEWEQSSEREARVDRILSEKWEPDPRGMKVDGQPVAEYLRNTQALGTNRPSLSEMLTPRQITTGGEPEDLTFEVPLRYAAVTNIGNLILLVDADPEEVLTSDAGGKVQELSSSPDGSCRLVWHTIYDPMGRHAVQLLLIVSSEQAGEFAGKGPAIAVTTSNLCQFSLESSVYDVERGEIFHGRLADPVGQYTIECLTTNGEHLATLSGSTTNGEFKVIWNLVDDHGHRLTGEPFNSILHLTLPESGRRQTMKGP
jgi:hypothetical protein